MSKKIIMALAAASIVGSVNAKEIAYSQNNLPHQNEVKSQYPFLVNAELLYGRIITNATFPIYVFNGKSQVITYSRSPNHNRFGFRVGIGSSIKNKFNLSGQWTYLPSGKKETLSITLNSGDVLQPYVIQQISGPGSYEVDVKDKQWMHWGDFLVQTASWMLSSNLRLQPFGGVRYFYWKKSEAVKTSQTASLPSSILEKINGTGVFIGTDVKYVLSRFLHFYSNFSVGTLAGFYAVNVANVAAQDEVGDNLRAPLNFSPWVKFTFGVGSEFKVGNDVLFSTRLFYEIFNMENDISTLPLPLQYGQFFLTRMIKTQIFGLGVTGIF